MGLDETSKSSFYATSFVFKSCFQRMAILTVQRAHAVSVDSSSIVVILVCGRFKGKSEAIKGELSKVFFVSSLSLLIRL